MSTPSFGTSRAPGDLVGARSTIDARGVFGHVMGLVALTLAFTAGGAYIGRDLPRGAGLACWVIALVCLFGLRVAARRSESLAITVLFGVGLLLGLALGPTLHYYASTQPQVVWQAAGATALFVGALGSAGYAIRRDLSHLYRVAFFALLALLLFGLVAAFTAMPHANVIYAVAGLAVFSLYTVIDFNRLRRAGMDQAVLLAAGIFLDVLNVFLFFLSLFGGGSNRR